MIDLLLQKSEGLLYWIAAAVMGWIGWSVKTRFVPREEHNKLQDRVTELENVVKVLPSAREINALRAQMGDVSSELRVFNTKQGHTDEKLNRLQTQLDRMDTYLRSSNGGRS